MKNQAIIPSRRYPCYWEYKGKPVMLLGGSREDNLYQIANVEEELATLKKREGTTCAARCPAGMKAIYGPTSGRRTVSTIWNALTNGIGAGLRIF